MPPLSLHPTNPRYFTDDGQRAVPGAHPPEGGDYAVTAAPFTGDALLYLKSM